MFMIEPFCWGGADERRTSPRRRAPEGEPSPRSFGHPSLVASSDFLQNNRPRRSDFLRLPLAGRARTGWPRRQATPPSVEDDQLRTITTRPFPPADGTP